MGDVVSAKLERFKKKGSKSALPRGLSPKETKKVGRCYTPDRVEGVQNHLHGQILTQATSDGSDKHALLLCVQQRLVLLSSGDDQIVGRGV